MDIIDFALKLCAITDPRVKRRKFASSSLRKLALSTVVKHVNHFLLIGFKAKSTPTNPYKILPYTLRNELLCEFTSSSSIYIPSDKEYGYFCAIKWLLNPSTTEFKFPAFSNQAFNSDLWKIMTLICLHLKKVEWSHSAKNENALYRACFFSSLVQYKDLQEIEISEIECDDLDLCRLAANFPKLRRLKIELADSVSKAGFNALSNLEDLRFLLYGFKPAEILEQQFYLCMLFLPKLHYFQYKYDCALIHTFFEPLFDCVMNALGNVQHSGIQELTLGLKCLFLKNVVNPPAFLKLPNLELLCLLNPSNDFYPDDRLSKVTALSLHGADMDVSSSILRQIGHQLSELSISVIGNLTLNVVFKECQNLVKLYIEQDQQHIFLSPHLNQGCKNTLKQLHITQKDNGANQLLTNLQPGLLMQLLQLPNLKTFISTAHLSLEEADSIMKAVQEKSILQLVETFCILTPRDCDVPEEFQDYLVEYKKQVYSVLFCVAKHCPNSTDIH